MSGASRDAPPSNEGDKLDARGSVSGPVMREEKGDVISSRVARFVDVGNSSDVFKSPSLNNLNLKPFYNGVKLDSRMAEIRKSINHIRVHWSEYDIFMAGLKELLLGEEEGLVYKDVTARSLSEELLSSQRDWLPQELARNKTLKYEAIKLYTTEEGQKKVYGVGGKIFRNEDSVALVEMIRSVVFLVELLNIDLFNLCQNRPDKCNYEGIVYRGLCVNDEDFESFMSLRKERIGRRNIAIPLGLVSASSSIKVAEKFIKIQLKKDKDKKEEDRNANPIIIRTHVIGLKPEYVEHYNRTFPSTVLTTICAVDIHDISVYPEEEEVLLRGPFLQILDLQAEKHDVPGGKCQVLETVMLNSNRDHISTSLLGEDAAPARNMFSTMVTVTRSEFAIKFCERKGLLEDAEEYRKILNENLIKLEGLMNK